MYLCKYAYMHICIYIYVNMYICIFVSIYQSIYLSIYIYMSSRHNLLHLITCYCLLLTVVIFLGDIELSSVLCHYRFWKGPYRCTVFRAHLWQKCFCNTTVVFNQFDCNSNICTFTYMHMYTCMRICKSICMRMFMFMCICACMVNLYL